MDKKEFTGTRAIFPGFSEREDERIDTTFYDDFMIAEIYGKE